MPASCNALQQSLDLLYATHDNNHEIVSFQVSISRILLINLTKNA